MTTLIGAPAAKALIWSKTVENCRSHTPVLRSVALYNPLLTELVAHLPPVSEDAAPGLRLVAEEPS